MKVLAINGSARKDGNTAILIKYSIEELHKAGIETEMVQLSGKIIEPCKACLLPAGEKKNCVHNKDMFPGNFREDDTGWMGSFSITGLYTGNISAENAGILERASVVTDITEWKICFQHQSFWGGCYGCTQRRRTYYP